MRSLFLIALLFVAACSPSFTSTQEIKEIKILSNSSQNLSGQNKNISNAVKATVPAVVPIANLNGSQNWMQQGFPMKGYTKTGAHIIEVVDVDVGAKGCLVSVDGVISFIHTDESQIVNGVKVYVLDARAFKSATQDSDSCLIAIA